MNKKAKVVTEKEDRIVPEGAGYKVRLHARGVKLFRNETAALIAEFLIVQPITVTGDGWFYLPLKELSKRLGKSLVEVRRAIVLMEKKLGVIETKRTRSTQDGGIGTSLRINVGAYRALWATTYNERLNADFDFADIPAPPGENRLYKLEDFFPEFNVGPFVKYYPSLDRALEIPGRHWGAGAARFVEVLDEERRYLQSVGKCSEWIHISQKRFMEKGGFSKGVLQGLVKRFRNSHVIEVGRWGSPARNFYRLDSVAIEAIWTAAICSEREKSVIGHSRKVGLKRYTNPPTKTHTNPPTKTHTNPPTERYTNPPTKTHTNPPTRTKYEAKDVAKNEAKNFAENSPNDFPEEKSVRETETEDSSLGGTHDGVERVATLRSDDGAVLVGAARIVTVAGSGSAGLSGAARVSTPNSDGAAVPTGSPTLRPTNAPLVGAAPTPPVAARPPAPNANSYNAVEAPAVQQPTIGEMRAREAAAEEAVLAEKAVLEAGGTSQQAYLARWMVLHPPTPTPASPSPVWAIPERVVHTGEVLTKAERVVHTGEVLTKAERVVHTGEVLTKAERVVHTGEVLTKAEVADWGAGFEEAWLLYPARKGVKNRQTDARRVWNKISTKNRTTAVLRGIRNYSVTMTASDSYAVDMFRFVNEQMWFDYQEEPDVAAIKRSQAARRGKGSTMDDGDAMDLLHSKMVAIRLADKEEDEERRATGKPEVYVCEDEDGDSRYKIAAFARGRGILH